MIFTTWPFAVYMAAVFACYWWVVPAGLRRAFLLVTGLAYFTYHYPPYTLLLAGLTLITYVCGNVILVQKLQNRPAKAALYAGLAVSVGTLAFFKYTKMFVAAWNALSVRWELHADLPVPQWMVPLGISFFTFEFVHYLADIYHGKIAKPTLLDFAGFAFFFPSLVSGPVKRFQIFQDQAAQIRRFRIGYVTDGLPRIVTGVAKKLIIADTAVMFTRAFTEPNQSSRPMLWVAMYAYAVYIYYDFSGYTDIAIGCAQLLGYRLPENFNRPYRQVNISKFWNNWHMSLSSWIRDYLFIPMGSSRVRPWRVLFNLTVVMGICGIWHGANWNFLAWGLYHGLGLAGLRIYQQKIGMCIPDTRAIRWLSRAVTFQFVCFGWVLFAAPGLPEALVILRRML